MGNPVRILVADDHTIVRQGLARMLNDQPDLKVVGEAVNGRSAVDKALELKPDIVIMDIAMPQMNGIEAAKRIRKDLPKTKIVILSMYSHEHYIHNLLEAGISGYLLKDSSGNDIVQAIHAAMKDETFLSPSISKVLVDTYRTPRKASSLTERYRELSNREREVFQLIAEGRSTRQISEMLFISISTVKSHRSKIMEKLGAESSVQLVRFAIQLGIIDPDL
ncbi:MAG: response regulator transcription factor [Deltaproteobacteria bacterium]|nr:response regulator transcription factor [Deltaproteobacteria bacterium]MBW1954779.1 response regulator transcription factor [Deltaproteobacteria bacterium]MBW2040676.1 response regulator transcription factor [Deltaproteobacteria bacterium]MBW2132501.1 response regulator transcription factor [Deltaproteobacteria bacterium]